MSSAGKKANPPGVKRVLRPDGQVYLYAWRGRGAPRLYEPEGSESLWKEWKHAIANGGRVRLRGDDVASWLTEWQESPDFARLAKGTQRTYEGAIAKIRTKFGTASPLAFEARSMRPVLLAWRDELAKPEPADIARGLRGGPAAADNTMASLRAFLAWIMDRGVIGHHVAGRIKKLAHPDRADVIWTDRHIATWRAGAPASLVRVMDVARLTGLAAVDLCRLEWEMVDVDEIEIRRQKTDELALIPVLDELREVLAPVPRSHAKVLVNSAGRPWNERSLSVQFSVVEKRLGMAGMHLHDLRGTAATEFCRAGLDDREVAEIMGWSPQSVAKIRRRYVGRRAIINNAVAKLADYRRAKAANEAKSAA